MRERLKMRREGATAWLLTDATSGADVGGINYDHAIDGNHYLPWLLVEGVKRYLGDGLPQLAMAARVVSHAYWER